jgi:hypothetical protein
MLTDTTVIYIIDIFKVHLPILHKYFRTKSELDSNKIQARFEQNSSSIRTNSELDSNKIRARFEQNPSSIRTKFRATAQVAALNVGLDQGTPFWLALNPILSRSPEIRVTSRLLISSLIPLPSRSLSPFKSDNPLFVTEQRFEKQKR